MKHEPLHGYGDIPAGYVMLRSWYPDEASQHHIDPAPRPTCSRYSDQSLDWRSRLFGLGSTTGLVLAILAGLFATWHAVQPMVAPSEALVVTMEPLAAPPEPMEAVPEGPRRIEKEEQKVEREEQPEPPKIVIPQLKAPEARHEPLAAAAKPADPVPETTAPKTLPAPPARHTSSNADATWEALLLAHLEKYRRYPPAARARREEGAAFVSFRMNRAGKILSASLARSSGSVFLDRAALETIRRAQPLPAIPDDKPEELELSLPIEFFLQR
ncbi:energy transducer TonB family protein [Novosphingobium sp.]|jgi:protein TonB|uniref:energy transducer TonB family protein n=1 Tax=Novosphingobium sp. TaxID=1874826 RepID=UPI002FDF29E1